jgi:hypothetical protein
MKFSQILEKIDVPEEIDGIKLKDVTIHTGRGDRSDIIVARAVHNPTGIEVSGEGRKGQDLRNSLIRKIAIKLKEKK